MEEVDVNKTRLDDFVSSLQDSLRLLKGFKRSVEGSWREDGQALWGKPIGEFMGLTLNAYIAGFWQRREIRSQTLWAGFEGRSLRNKIKYLEVDITLTNQDTVRGRGELCKESIQLPRNYERVYESYEIEGRSELYYGINQFNDDDEAFLTAAVSFFSRSFFLLEEESLLKKGLGNLSETDRDAVIRARVGQGIFRKNVSEIEKCCRITGVSDERFLRASHIKPWSQCESKEERLDGNNGLFLTPSIDHLFDRFYISFNENGELLFSAAISKEVYEKLGVRELKTPKRFKPEQKKYLEFHRKVFLSGNPKRQSQ